MLFISSSYVLVGKFILIALISQIFVSAMNIKDPVTLFYWPVSLPIAHCHTVALWRNIACTFFTKILLIKSRISYNVLLSSSPPQLLPDSIPLQLCVPFSRFESPLRLNCIAQLLLSRSLPCGVVNRPLKLKPILPPSSNQVPVDPQLGMEPFLSLVIFLKRSSSWQSFSKF